MYFNKFSVHIFLVLKYMLLVLVEIAICQKESPCPAVFRYKYDPEFTRIYGILKIPFPKIYRRTLLLKVELLIENQVSEQELHNIISFLGTPDDIIQKKPLFFRLEFPFWESYFTQITKIFINDELLCISDYINLSETNDQTLTMVNSYFTIPTFDYSENVNLNIEENVEHDFQNHDQYIDSQSEYFYYADSSFGNSIPFEREPVVETLEIDEFSDCGLSAPETNNEDDFNLLRKHPWVGGLYKKNTSDLPLSNNYPSDNLEFICRLSLITSTCALTAAPCVSSFDLQDLYAIFGRNNINDKLNSVDKYYQIRKFKTINIHPDFDRKTSDADIAILSFDKKVEFTNYIRPICLWQLDSNLNRVVNIEGTLIGMDENNNLGRSKQFFASIVSDETCLRSAEPFISITSDRTFCAGYKDGIGPCTGDAGSGLYISVKGRWFIRGIIGRVLSKLDGTCDRTQYYVYVDVAKYIDWIINFLYREKFRHF